MIGNIVAGIFSPTTPLAQSFDCLVVAGGGGGGNGITPGGGTGGGGAGGFRLLTSQSLSFGVSYTVTIGTGGAQGTTGVNSSIIGGAISISGSGGGGASGTGQGDNANTMGNSGAGGSGIVILRWSGA